MTAPSFTKAISALARHGLIDAYTSFEQAIPEVTMGDLAEMPIKDATDIIAYAKMEGFIKVGDFSNE